MSYKVGIAWRDTGVRRRQTLFETCGLRDIQYGGHTAPVLDSEVRELVSFFTRHAEFVPVQGRRTTIHSLDMISKLSVGAHLKSSHVWICMSLHLRSGDLAPTVQRINEAMNAVEAKAAKAAKTALAAKTVTSTRAASGHGLRGGVNLSLLFAHTSWMLVRDVAI